MNLQTRPTSISPRCVCGHAQGTHVRAGSGFGQEIVRAHQLHQRDFPAVVDDNALVCQGSRCGCLAYRPVTENDSHGDKAQEAILRDQDSYHVELRLRDHGSVALYQAHNGDIVLILPGDLWSQTGFRADRVASVGPARVATFSRIPATAVAKEREI